MLADVDAGKASYEASHLVTKDKLANESFIGSLDAVEVGQLFLVLLFGIFLLIHSWAKYNKLLHRLVGKRLASKVP